jgi:hypothetical protein
MSQKKKEIQSVEKTNKRRIQRFDFILCDTYFLIFLRRIFIPWKLTESRATGEKELACKQFRLAPIDATMQYEKK